MWIKYLFFCHSGCGAVVKQAGEGLQSSYIIDTGSPPGVSAFTYYFPPWDLSFFLDLAGVIYATIVFHYLSKVERFSDFLFRPSPHHRGTSIFPFRQYITQSPHHQCYTSHSKSLQWLATPNTRTPTRNWKKTSISTFNTFFKLHLCLQDAIF